MSEEIEKATAMETFEETNAIVQVLEFVYDPEALNEDVDFTHSSHLLIYGGNNESFAKAMKNFLHAAATGRLDSIEQRFDEESDEYVTDICFRCKSESDASN